MFVSLEMNRVSYLYITDTAFLLKEIQNVIPCGTVVLHYIFTVSESVREVQKQNWQQIFCDVKISDI